FTQFLSTTLKRNAQAKFRIKTYFSLSEHYQRSQFIHTESMVFIFKSAWILSMFTVYLHGQCFFLLTHSAEEVRTNIV
ncbi:hypothetical protein, partial [Acinetobacter baumannii]|uniref:hypothetical protein n=1 Tax=Acinetobacter baumannii TaxID=470 RepID=UPI0033976B6C